jgi:hypothetical protein
MEEPPFDPGAEKVIVALRFPAVALADVGAPGKVYGVTLFDATLETLAPAALVAFTVNVYAVPAVRPLTVIGLEDAEAVIFPGEEVTV